MGHGEHVAVNDTKMPDDYYCNVRKDVQELRKLYPFVYFLYSSHCGIRNQLLFM